MEFWEHWHSNISVFGFVIAIILIGSFFSYLKQRSRHELIREAMRSGQSIDPDLLKDLKDEDEKGGMIIAGAILLAVAVGLAALGYQIDKVEESNEVFEIMKGVAVIPALIGVVLLIAGLIEAATRKKS